MCHVVFQIVDEHGTRITNAENEVTFEVAGPAKIIGIDNGKRGTGNIDYKDNKHNAYEGRGLLIIQSQRKKGKVTVKAVAEGLEAGQVTLEVE